MNFAVLYFSAALHLMNSDKFHAALRCANAWLEHHCIVLAVLPGLAGLTLMNSDKSHAELRCANCLAQTSLRCACCAAWQDSP